MPQPIDLPTELARSSTTERIQQIADRASLAAQQRAATEAEEERVKHETQVQETTESQSKHVDADGRPKNPFVKRRRKRAEDDASDSATPNPGDLRVIPEGGEEHHLDVTV